MHLGSTPNANLPLAGRHWINMICVADGSLQESLSEEESVEMILVVDARSDVALRPTDK